MADERDPFKAAMDGLPPPPQPENMPERPVLGGSGTQNSNSGAVGRLSLFDAISPRTAAELHGLAPIPKRGPGRPPGSKNQKTKDRLAALEKMNGITPLEQMWKFVAASPFKLLAEANAAIPLDALGQPVRPLLSLWEIIQEQNRMRVAMLPFVHQKLPPAFEAEDVRALLVLNQGGADGAEDDIQEFETNQGVIDLEATELNAGELNAQPKPLKDKEE